MFKHIMKGVDLRNPNLTRDPRIWFRYLCWCLSNWMETHKPYYPMFVRRWAGRHYSGRRMAMTWKQIRWWQEANPNYVPTDKPLPWWLGERAMGPFHQPWMRLSRWIKRRTSGLSHRSDFTDRENGILYGYKGESVMNQAWDKFIGTINEEPDADDQPAPFSIN